MREITKIKTLFVVNCFWATGKKYNNNTKNVGFRRTYLEWLSASVLYKLEKLQVLVNVLIYVLN